MTPELYNTINWLWSSLGLGYKCVSPVTEINIVPQVNQPTNTSNYPRYVVRLVEVMRKVLVGDMATVGKQISNSRITHLKESLIWWEKKDNLGKKTLSFEWNVILSYELWITSTNMLSIISWSWVQRSPKTGGKTNAPVTNTQIFHLTSIFT